MKSDEIGTEAKLDGDLGAKAKMCTPVHGLFACSIAEKPESPCTGVHIFTFTYRSRPILASVPISSDFDFSAEIRLSSGLPEVTCRANGRAGEKKEINIYKFSNGSIFNPQRFSPNPCPCSVKLGNLRRVAERRNTCPAQRPPET